MQDADITTHKGVVRPSQWAVFVSSPGAVLASAVHTGSKRRRLISSVSCSVSSTCPVEGRSEIKDKCSGYFYSGFQKYAYIFPRCRHSVFHLPCATSEYHSTRPPIRKSILGRVNAANVKDTRKAASAMPGASEGVMGLLILSCVFCPMAPFA